jgi:hypothetical protein
MNALKIQRAEQEMRQKAKVAHEQKVQRDKEQREKELAKKEKAKKKTEKHERRRM